jgi:hypothetical protein
MFVYRSEVEMKVVYIILLNAFLFINCSYADGENYQTGMCEDKMQSTTLEHYAKPLSIVAAQIADIQANILAQALGSVKVVRNKNGESSVVVGKRFHDSGPASIVQQIEKVHKITGRKVGIIHVFGHAQGGFDAQLYSLDTSAARRIRDHVTDDVKVVFHGCRLPHNDNVHSFLANLPPNASLYGHQLRAQLGQTFDWVRFYKTKDEKTGKMKTHKEKLGKKPIIGEILPEEYVRKWVRLAMKPSYNETGRPALTQWLQSDKIMHFIPSDVEKIMRSEASKQK